MREVPLARFRLRVPARGRKTDKQGACQVALAGDRPKNRQHRKLCPGFWVAAGITFQLTCGRDVGPHSRLFCRACPCLLVAVARLAGRWCFWRLCSWRWCFSLVGGFGFSFSVALREDADPRTGFLFLRYPIRCSETSVPCIMCQRSAGLLVVYVVTNQIVGVRRHPGATILAHLRPPPTIASQALRLVQNFLMHLLQSCAS